MNDDNFRVKLVIKFNIFHMNDNFIWVNTEKKACKIFVGLYHTATNKPIA